MLRKSFYRRIQASFLILILIPILALSLLSYSIIKQTMMDKIRQANQSVLELMVKDISKLVDELASASHYYARDPSIRQHLHTFADMKEIVTIDDYNSYTRIQSFFEQAAVKSVNKDIWLFLVNEQSFVIPYMTVNEGMGGGIEQMQRHWKLIQPRVDQGISDKLQWIGTVPSEGRPGETYYYLGRVIHDGSPQGRVLATFMVGISSRYFDSLFAAVAEGQFALYDADGGRIAGSEASPFHNDGDAADGDIRSEAVIPKTGWKLVYHTPKQAVTGQISQTFYVSGLLVLGLSVGFLLFAVVLARRLHHPIRQLQGLAKQFGGGNRKVRYVSEGSDEFEELGQAVNLLLGEIDELIQGIEREQEQKRLLELRALFAQIRPHFLLNTLNSIKCSLLIERDRKHGGQIDALMSLLKAYMKVDQPSTLERECILLQHYIEIMQMRSSREIRLQVRLEDELRQLPVPMLTLQPLVENAIVHGLADTDEPGSITVRAFREHGWIHLQVSDNGTGIPEEKLEALNHLFVEAASAGDSGYERVGLVNVLQRLRLSHGTQAVLRLENRPDGGATAMLRWPDNLN
ncbi:sensor histidine kinase [Paenibacillus silviterrae]|uniref:sensor histidine kinase n=1 Tax=Paenibacillus silviterrae TaxID=3242194 RepID=UPI002542F55D|nr:sensor histidine kinase [Paenibacillus chinjuensis]